MKISDFGHLPLVISMSALLVSCDQKVAEKVDPEGAVVSTAELAREARFSPWTSRAGLELKMERLPGDQYFSVVQGRLKDGANQYRAISETFDGETYREWAAFTGLSERELFEHELALLRAGFEHRDSQVFTDSSGVAIHQLVMLRRITALSTSPRLTNGSGADRRVTSASVAPSAGGDVLEVPDFMQPELRPLDDAPVPTSEPVSDPVEEISSETPVVNEVATAEVTPDPPKPADPPVVEIVEEPAPDPEVEPLSAAEAKKPEAKPESELKTHRVVRGDTLSSVARRYGVKVADLKRANSLRTDIIRLKQVLKIPTR